MLKNVLFTVVGLLLFGASPSTANIDPEPGHQSDNIPLINDNRELKVDATHQKASRILVSTAGWIDSFFDDDRYIEEENTTRAKMRLSFGYSHFDDFEFSPSVSLRFKLPKLSKKALLLIGASDDDEFDINNDPISDNPQNDDNEKNDLTAGLRYIIKVGKSYHFSTTAGVSWDYAYVGLRYRHQHDFGTWLGRFTNNLKYYTDDGFENKFSIDSDRPISKRWFIRNSINVNWFEEEEGLPHKLILRLYHVLNSHQAFQYSIGNFFDTEPNYQMTDLQLKIRYRQRFYRDWLVLELAPQVSFPKKYDRKANPGIVLQFEADFGYMGDQDIFKSVFGF